MFVRSASPFYLRSCRSAVLAATVAALPLSLPAARGAGTDKPAADIPVKRVVMFSSGVAFFEHGGEVEGNAPST